MYYNYMYTAKFHDKNVFGQNMKHKNNNETNKQTHKFAQAYRTRDLSLRSRMLYHYTTESTDLVDWVQAISNCFNAMG